jgi:hypothetical protein
MALDDPHGPRRPRDQRYDGCATAGDEIRFGAVDRSVDPELLFEKKGSHAVPCVRWRKW